MSFLFFDTNFLFSVPYILLYLQTSNLSLLDINLLISSNIILGINFHSFRLTSLIIPSSPLIIVFFVFSVFCKTYQSYLVAHLNVFCPSSTLWISKYNSCLFLIISKHGCSYWRHTAGCTYTKYPFSFINLFNDIIINLSHNICPFPLFPLSSL